MKYIPRLLEKAIIEANRSFKVLFLGGPRQVGKTTMLKFLADRRGYRYVTLDDINLRELARNDPALFLQQFSSPLVIDEIQYAPEILPYIKKIVDTSEAGGQYWLTGSQQFRLMKNIQESLAGRVAIFNLFGLSRGEINKISAKHPFQPPLDIRQKARQHPNINNLFDSIFTGGFPVFHQTKKPDRDIYFNSYLQTYIDRDLVDIFGISKTTEFNRFLQACAARTAQVLNISDLARDSGISPPAAREWLGILESSNQVYLLPPYFANFTKRLIKSPKLYFLDTGFASYLTRWNSARSLQSGAMSGAMHETYIVSEIIKSFAFRGKTPPIYYYRDKEKREVDVVFEESGALHLMEIKLSTKINSKQAENMEYVSERVRNVKSKSIVSLIEHPLVSKGGVTYLPYTFIN